MDEYAYDTLKKLIHSILESNLKWRRLLDEKCGYYNLETIERVDFEKIESQIIDEFEYFLKNSSGR